METTEWLYNLAVRHDRLLVQLADWAVQRELDRELSPALRGNVDVTTFLDGYGQPDVTAFHEAVVADCGQRPAGLASLAPVPMLLLANLFKKVVAGEEEITGLDLVGKLMIDDLQAHQYLRELNLLATEGWLTLNCTKGNLSYSLPPLCWLKATCEFGSRFHDLLGATAPDAGFTGNAECLEALFAYLKPVEFHDLHPFKLRNQDATPERHPADPALKRLEGRAKRATSPLPCWEARQHYGLSRYQHLCLIGMLGQQDGELDQDFSDPNDVVRLFARGVQARETMREHLFGDASPLIRHRLIEGEEGHFGRRFSLSQAGISVLLGRKLSNRNKGDRLEELARNTIFTSHRPRVDATKVFLPATLINDLAAIEHGETPKGRRDRRRWQQSLPTAWGAPTGTTILLYGPPGTGKTLTAQYLASRLRRPLLTVDASQVLGMWVGQSEKSVKQVFADYRTLHAALKRAPVLLFNEADQLLGHRGGGERAVDKMHNNLQNLFLEGLERFEGILVATTNRRDLLDDAFARRFTYKWELPTPDRAVRIAIWQGHLPQERLAPDVDLDALAELGLTGGEIRLVVEQAVRKAAWQGARLLSQELLLQIARQELAGRFGQSAKRVGF